MTGSQLEYGHDGENIEHDVADADTEITYNISSSGVETATEKFLAKGSMGAGFTLRPDNTVQITQIGSKVFRNPITVSTAGLTISPGNYRWFDIIKVKTTVGPTNIKLLVI